MDAAAAMALTTSSLLAVFGAGRGTMFPTSAVLPQSAVPPAEVGNHHRRNDLRPGHECHRSRSQPSRRSR